MRLNLLILLTFFVLSSCASKPVLYPNKKYQSVGKEQAKADIDSCEDKADEFINSSKGKKILKSAGKGGILGGAVGAVTGILSGDVAGGLAQGAAIGATAGGVGQAISPDQLKRSFINRCLSKKGYEVMGWD